MVLPVEDEGILDEMLIQKLDSSMAEFKTKTADKRFQTIEEELERHILK